MSTTPCTKCGYPLRAQIPGDKCPICSLEFSQTSDRQIPTSTRPAAPSRLALETTESFVAATIDYAPSAETQDNDRTSDTPKVGSQFGNYLIIEKLGEGGMGVVFEAEEIDSGRRVALKFISAPFLSPERRERFLREGQLAASIKHPNSVYIFGTEEIDNVPVISMELVRGPSLDRLVAMEGPRPVAWSVDALLQVIAALEAADRCGVLHRDVKPGNCFVDVASGAVKVGDYGLALDLVGEDRLTRVKDGGGTPAYQSPEQWKLEPLDVRSDIYGVGGTLHFLLTGLTPFDEPDRKKLFYKVQHERPRSVASVRGDVPRDLANIIFRCLERDPDQRYQNYDELRAALRPAKPASLLIRGFAGVIDAVVIAALSILQTFVLLACGVNPSEFWRAHPWLLMLNSLWDVVYYAIPEGIWGASLGKWSLGLRVTNRNQAAPGLSRALARAAIFVVLPSIPVWIAIWMQTNSSSAHLILLQAFLTYSGCGLSLLLFSSMRTGNQFAAWHDLASGTRVASLRSLATRSVLEVSDGASTVADSTTRIGPYLVIHSLGAVGKFEWLLGYDDRLQRNVWICLVPANLPPLPSPVCSVGREGRVRWLAGRRSAGANWDAFESIPGRPLISFLHQPQPWRHVRYWLFDLARELAAGVKDGTLPAKLSLSHVWITSKGEAVLLDAPVPGAGPISDDRGLETVTDALQSARLFLRQVVLSCLKGRAYTADAAANCSIEQRLPLPDPVLAWVATHFGDSTLRFTNSPQVSRLRRGAIVFSCLLLPIIVVGSWLALSFAQHLWSFTMPEVRELRECLIRYEPWPGTDRTRTARNAEERAALEVYIAGKYARTIRDPKVWLSPYALSMIPPVPRESAERIVAMHGQPSEAEVAAAENRIRPLLPAHVGSDSYVLPFADVMLMAAVGVYVLGFFIAVPAGIASAIFRRGPLQKIFGIEYVMADGRPAGRLRLLWRSLLAWSPVLIGPFAVNLLRPSLGHFTANSLLVGVCLTLTLWSFALKNRGLADCLAGVWIVPR